MKFRLTAVLVICGFFLTILGGRGLLLYVMPAKDLYDPNVNWENLKSGQRVVCDIDFIMDPFMETYDDNGSISSLYAMPDLVFYDGEPYVEMKHFIGVQVFAKDYPAYDAIYDNSFDVWTKGEGQLGDGGVIHFDGYLRKMKTKGRNGGKSEYDYYREYVIDDLGYTEAEMVPYIMVENKTPIANLGMFLGGVLMLAGGVVTGLLFFRKK